MNASVFDFVSTDIIPFDRVLRGSVFHSHLSSVAADWARVVVHARVRDHKGKTARRAAFYALNKRACLLTPGQPLGSVA